MKYRSERSRKSIRHELASRALYGGASKSAGERAIMQGFLSRVALTSCQVEYSDKPDVKLTFGGPNGPWTVGVEITQYYADMTRKGSLQKRFVEQWKELDIRLRRRLSRKNSDNRYLYAAVHFKDDSYKILDNIDVDQFIRELVLLVHLPVRHKTIRQIPRTKFPLAAELVEHIYLMNTYPEKNIKWWPAHLQSGAIVDPSLKIGEIIKEKNRKAQGYGWNGIQEKWLLIYSGTQGKADLVGFFEPDAVGLRIENTQFDRIYIWNRFFEQVDQLFPQYRRAFDPDENVVHRKAFSDQIIPFLGTH